jgi:hypothetical protein
MLELKGGANNPPAPAMHVESTSTHKEESNDGKEKEESGINLNLKNTFTKLSL